jgi:7-cyano-7-deazaguanine synthase
MKPDTVAILSGGMDSTVLTWKLACEGRLSSVLSFNYGQRHAKELEAAIRIVGLLDTKALHHTVDLSGVRPIIARGSLVGDQSVPEGHYADDNMKATVVPNRNMIMLAVAAGHAMATGAKRVAYAAHGGDHTIYPDCREDFVNALNTAVGLADWSRVTVFAPFVRMSKADIVTLGNQLEVPFALTWSCYKGELHHCGVCGTCVERREAFLLAGVEDPTVYQPL